MSQYFKMDPARWISGTNALTIEQEHAYFRIICATHLYDEPISDNPRVLAGLFRCNQKKAKRLLVELVAAGKVSVEDGKIHNPRADDELSTRRALSVDQAAKGRTGGLESGKTRAKALINNDQVEASASTETKPNRIEYNRIDNTPKPPSAKNGSTPYTQEFEEAYKQYGIFEAKNGAWNHWKRLSPEDRKAAVASFPAWFRKKPDKNFRPYFRTYLSQRMWEDVTQSVNGEHSNYYRDPSKWTRTTWETVKQTALKENRWSKDWGDPKLVPQDLIDDDLRRIFAGLAA